MVRELVSDSASFFGQKTNDRGFTREVVVLLLIGAFGAVGAAYLGQTMLGELQDPGDKLVLPFVSSGVTIFLGPLVLWVYYGLVVHVGLRFFNDRGPISRVLKIIPWALVPLAVANLIYSVALIVAVSSADIPATIPGTSASQKYAFLMDLVKDHPLVLLAALITIVVIGYSAHLMAIGVAIARDVDYEQASKVVGVAATGHGLYIAYSALTAAGFL